MRHSISPFETDYRTYSNPRQHYYSDYLTEPNYDLPQFAYQNYEQPQFSGINANYSNYCNCDYRCQDPPLRQSWSECIPYEKSVIEFVPQAQIEMIPVERKFIDYQYQQLSPKLTQQFMPNVRVQSIPINQVNVLPTQTILPNQPQMVAQQQIVQRPPILLQNSGIQTSQIPINSMPVQQLIYQGPPGIQPQAVQNSQFINRSVQSLPMRQSIIQNPLSSQLGPSEIQTQAVYNPQLITRQPQIVQSIPMRQSIIQNPPLNYSYSSNQMNQKYQNESPNFYLADNENNEWQRRSAKKSKNKDYLLGDQRKMPTGGCCGFK